MAITASYVLTLDHYRAMVRASEDRVSRFLSRWLFWPLLGFNALGAAFLFYVRVSDNDPIGRLPFFSLAIVVLMLAGRYVLIPAILSWGLRSTRLGGRNYIVSLGAEAVDLQAGDISSRIGLGEIIRASETESHFFLWFNKRQAAIVPKDAINRPDNSETVRAYIASNGWELRT